MSEMKRKVAHAVALKWQFRNFGTFNERGDYVIDSTALDAFEALCQETAVAAIESMREPTEAMCFVNGPGDQHNYADAEARETWRKMIDAALKDEQ